MGVIQLYVGLMILLSCAAPGDYTSLGAGATITFPAGTTRMGFDITITNDNVSEQNETFTAMLAVIAGQTPARVSTGAPNPTTLEIVDDG